MKNIAFNRLGFFACLILLLHSVSTALADGLTVEKVQRAYQARYKAVTGNYLEWPKCKSSTKTPAPQYPKDGFYGDLSKDPDKAVEVVQDLVQKFYYNDKIFDKFLTITAFSELEGASSLPVFSDEPAPTSVTADNYQDALQQIESELTKMKFCKAITYQASAPNQDTRTTLSFGNTPSDAETCAAYHHGPIANPVGPWEPTPWGRSLRYDTSCSEPPVDFDTSIEFEVRSVSGAGIPSWGGAYWAGLWNVRGHVLADLRDFSRSKNAQLFLRYAAPKADGDSIFGEFGFQYTNSTYHAPATKPTSASENCYGVWPGVVPKLGGWWNSDPIPGSDEIQQHFGTFVADTLDTEGWCVEDAVVVVDGDFTTVPDPQDCCSCGSCEPGAQDSTLQSLHVNIGLGSDNYGGSAGALSINADVPNPSLATTTGLRFSLSETVEQIPYQDSIMYGHGQIKTSQSLIDVLQDEDYEYTISIYDSAHIGELDESGEFFEPVGPPSTTIVVENPDHTTATYNQLRVTRTEDGETTVTDYTYTEDNTTTPPTDLWVMTTGSGFRKESRASQWNADHTICTETHVIKDNLNNVVYKEVNTYQLFAWGEEMLIQQVVDPDGANLLSTWHYYTDPNVDGGAYSQLKDYTDANGRWTRYQYDSSGRQTSEVIQFLNSAITSADSLNRVISTTYSTSDPQITIIEKLQDHEISRRYQVVHSDEIDDIVCQTVNAGPTASDNLVSVTKRYTTGTFQGEPSSILHPDGTMEFYTYVIDSVSGTRTDTIDSGQPNAEKSAIVDGIRTIAIKGSVGQMISRTVKDIASLSTPSPVTLSSEMYSDYDGFNRPKRVTFLDGTHSDVIYGCCGINAVTDRDSVMTQYLYDSLKRQYGYVKNGIKVEKIMDAIGQVVTEKRTGNDTPATTITLHQTGYDLAGRTCSETNALNGKTSYADNFDAGGMRVHTMTYPDAGTRIEIYNPDGSLASITGTAVFPVRYEYGIDQDSGVWRSYTKEVKLKLDGTDSSEWTKTYTDMAGRSYKTVFASASAPYPYRQSFYNNQGQLWKQRDPDNVVTLFQYNAKGEQEYTAVDVNHNDTIDFSGNDRITRNIRSVVATDGIKPDLVQVDNYVWKDGDSTGTPVSRSQTSTDGLKTWTTVFRDGSTQATSSTQTSYGSSRTEMTISPDNSYSIMSYSAGQLSSVTSYDSTGAPIGSTTYTYDAHGRQKTVVDTRNGATTFNYNNADLVTSTTTPNPGNGDPAQTTQTSYNTMLQPFNIVNPDQRIVTNEYFLTGSLKKTYGSRTYPVEYTYDYAGRVATMKTWQNFAANSGTAVTTWNYDPYRGWLANKRYADNTGPDYAYTVGGRLKTRAWARTGTGSQRILTTYSYGVDDGVTGNDHGDLVGIAYANDPQNTPALAYTYDRVGRQKTITRNGMTETLTYNDANQSLSDAYTGGTLDGLTVTSGFDTLLRRQSLSVNTQPSALTTTYTYDAASRLQTVADGNNNSATYTYTPNSPLVSKIDFKQNSTIRMTSTKSYDHLNRLMQVQNNVGAMSAASFDYVYNSANQRMQRTDVDGSRWVYHYDSLGQLTSGRKYWQDGWLALGQYFDYAFDDIGNRKWSQTMGSDPVATTTHVANYTANSLNQYVSRQVPGFFDIIGIAPVNADVWVNGDLASRHGEYFRKEISLAELGFSNNNTPIYWAVPTAVSGNPSVYGYKFVPPTPEPFIYDLDGNLIQDGRWIYTWDAENRLVKIESISPYPLNSRRSIAWEYDGRGRRIRQTTYSDLRGSFVLQEDVKFVNDGWNLVAELGAANNAVVRRYVWGNDLSGSVQGAGGVGGLLEMIYYGAAATNSFVAYDGNGNVSALVNAANGNSVAQYEYEPFGTLIRATGPLAKLNPFRFSTKYQDSETGLLYYSFRFYEPNLQCWLSRDPIGETGGVNLYSFVLNSPINGVDLYGLSFWGDEEQVVQNNLRSIGQGWNNFQHNTDRFFDWLNGGWSPHQITDPAVDFMHEHFGTPNDQKTKNDLAQSFAFGMMMGADIPEGGLVDLASPARRCHILDGEQLPGGKYSGGHRPGTGFPGKSEFPTSWSDGKIMHYISDVATDPASTFRSGQRPGDVFATGIREQIEIEVLIRSGYVWTGYPTRNP